MNSILAAALVAVVSAENDTDPYIPQSTQCPANFQYVRPADVLSDGEKDFLTSRDKNTREALIDWLGNSNLEDFDAGRFLSNGTIRIGLAYSGGGYRAMLAGAGQLAALDNRTRNATEDGHLGGLLQASTYLAGLSGGNWLVGSVAYNNFSSVEDLQFDGDLWDLEHSMLNPGGINIFSTFGYWDTIISNIQDKQDAGWNVSLTDLWGRGLGYQLFGGDEGAEGGRYSDIRDYDVFKNGEMPFPLHVSDRREIDELDIHLNSTVVEFNPLEIGSWDPNIYHFADLRYLGTAVSDSNVSSEDNCTVGYDNPGFMVGTSATLFNQFLLQINSTGILEEVKNLARSILDELDERSNDISLISPNPFYGIDGVADNQYEVLTLVDGGEDGQNIPIYPLYQPQREVDVVFAFDNSADTTDYWPNGTSLVETFKRQFGSQGNGTHFPYVPEAEAFVEAGLVGQPTFFGCNLTNLTSLYDDINSSTFSGVDPSNVPPVVVYIGNSNHSYASNIDTFQLSYENDQRDAIIRNGYDTMTQNNGTLDSDWRSALGCAIILREQQRRNQTPTEQCQQLLQNYCWSGSTSLSDQQSNGTNNTAPARRDGKSNTLNATKKKNSALSGAFVDRKTAALGFVLATVALIL